MRRLRFKFTPFSYLVIAQFLGALNDNLYRYFVIFLLIGLQGAENANSVVALAAAVFVVPFLLFSGAAGVLADSYSKSRITFWTKALEVVVAAVGVVAFALESPALCYLVIALLAVQSALFGPTKYGIVPELVGTDRLSQANGVVTSSTNIAAILGVVFASLFTTLTDRSFVVCGLVCVGVALVGLWASWRLPYTSPSGSKKKVSPHIFRELHRSLFEAKETPFLRLVILGSSFFLFAGSIVQMNAVPFAITSLGLEDVAGGYLFSVVTVGMGLGAVVAGRVSGRDVQLGLSVVGAAGICLSLLLLGILPATPLSAILLMILVGLSGGIYQIPLDSYIQYAAHPQRRGQAVAASSFLSFAGVALASGFFAMLGSGLGLSPQQVFLALGVICGGVALTLARVIPERLVHTLSRAVYLPMLEIQARGIEEFTLQATAPRLLVMRGCCWNDIFLLAGFAQSYRFYLPIELFPNQWAVRLLRCAGIVLYASEELETVHSELATDILNRAPAGQPLCLVIPPKHRCPMLEQMLPSAFPIVEVTIERPLRRAIQIHAHEL